MAAARGCSLPASTAAARRRRVAPIPFQGLRSVSRGRPSVRVPVLSKATMSMSERVSRASPLRNSTPNSAARPVPTMIAVGVARPMAQGQATTSTATALTRAMVIAGAGPRASQSDEGQEGDGDDDRGEHPDHPVGELLDRQFAPWARSTRRMIWARTVCPPTWVATSS